jgi:5-methylcytosine-specific restriction enzyme subunit McrC
MRTTDNKWDFTIPELAKDDLLGIADKKLADLVSDNPALLLFPEHLGDYGDKLEENCIFHLSGNILKTTNIMGFLGVNETRLTISSRFQKKETDKDHFLHYLLQKIFALNLFDLKVDTGEEDIWDIFLMYLFPYYLNKALNQGIYKEYKRQEHNDPNLKGRVDIPRHLKMNVPFTGNIAYQTREHTYDNKITQLIRHTITYISGHELSGAILSGQADTKSSVNQIFQATPSYNRGELRYIVEQNRKKVDHPYYTAYEPLRKICLQILRKEGICFGKEKDQVFGILFDGAWLWEEYINLLLKPLGYLHPQNKLGAEGKPVFLFQEKIFRRFPDFYHLERKSVIDAKYKALQGADLSREDLNQLISYLYILKGEQGYFLFPYIENAGQQIGILNGYGGTIFTYGMEIPSGHERYRDFTDKMAISERSLIDYFQKNGL